MSKETDSIHSSSNRASILDLFAPGKDITSTYYDGTYTSMTGTSMAAPHVAGAIAILQQSRMLELGIMYTPSEAETILKNNGKMINDTSTSTLYPRINVYNSIDVFLHCRTRFK